MENSEKNKDVIEEDIVNPWNVKSSSSKGVDYDKLISKFQSKFFFVLIYHMGMIWNSLFIFYSNQSALVQVKSMKFW